MLSRRRVQFQISLPRSKADWLDRRCEATNRRPSEVVEDMVDEAMEKEQGAKANGAAHKHDKAPARA